VIAPYATALAAMVDPGEAAANLRRLAREGARGEFGFYEALDYTPRDTEKTPDRAYPESEPAHAGRGLLRAPPGDDRRSARERAPERPDGVSLPRRRADPGTELLLQERVPRFVPLTRPRPIEVTRVAL